MTQKRTLACVTKAMQGCEQAPGISVLRHGIMVSEHYKDLIGHIRDCHPLRLPWKLPKWIENESLLVGLPDDVTMSQYHAYHDCGKPYCLTIDEDGKKHFQNHTKVSREVWLETGGSNEIGELIAQDMDIHLLKAVDIPDFAQRPHACALLLTGLSEVHANASMFGGMESTSFKMKWKHIDKRGRALLKHLEG